MLIRFATSDDFLKIKELWYECFLEHDSKASIDFYFKTRYKSQNCLLLLNEQDEILCSLQLNEHELRINQSLVPTRFFVGVATPKKHRKKGYMRVLMGYAINYLKDELHHELCILQAYNWDVYTSFGFEITYYKQELAVEKSTDIDSNLRLATKEDSFKMLEMYTEYTKTLDGYALRNLHYYENMFNSLSFDGIQCYISNDYYYLMIKQNNEYIVTEFVYKPTFDLNSLSQIFEQDVILQIDLKHNLNGAEIPNMAVKVLNDQAIYKYPSLKERKRLFINEQI